jgi:AraC family transcriptional regulator of adaptative response / DNA-3-methyladenine glycosylase II
VHFAKKLIDETNLQMTELALAAGYGSVRRFNAAIAKTYHRTPTQIRAIARQKHALPEHHYMFRLRFRPPYDWKFMLAFLAATVTPGIESVDANSYRRTISYGGTDGWFEVSRDDKYPALRARIQFGDPQALFHIVERIRALFDLNADWAAIVAGLGTDPLLAARLKAQPGLRVPGCWNGFEVATRAIIGRGLGTTEAASQAGAAARSFGRTFFAGGGLTHLFPEPQVLADADLTRVGLPRTRAETIRALSRAVCEGALRFEGVADSNVFLARLREIPGIDEWTAQCVAMRALGEPDAFPSENEMLGRRANAWHPWRAYAAMYLWSDLASPRPQQNLRPARRARRAG